MEPQKSQDYCKMEISEDCQPYVIEIDSTIPIEAEVLDESGTLAPVIIEEVDEQTLSCMDINMDEFIEAKTLKVHEIVETINAHESEVDNVNQVAYEEQQNQHLITKQFLEGQLTFAEYSSRMDQNHELDVGDADLENTKESESTGQDDNISVKKFRKYTRRRARNSLPARLVCLMGDVHSRYSRGENEMAAALCLEIIRQVSNNPEPFRTLAMIYENDQPEKSLQFSLIAAHLSPRDADQWIRLANLSLESGNIKQAITCYSKAIQASPKDISLYETRANLQEQSGDKRAYVKGYLRLIHQLGPEDGENIVKYAKAVTKICMQDNHYELALEAMDKIFVKVPDLVTLEEVNVMTELLIELKKFNRCLDILIKYTRIHIESVQEENKKQAQLPSDKTTTNEKLIITTCVIPDDVAVDLKAKCLITLIELDAIDIADAPLSKFFELENPEDSGDLFLDVAESLMSKKEFKRALILLEPLVKGPHFCLAGVWLRYAECWRGCNNRQKAILSYEVVTRLSPQHLEARIELAKLYKLDGQFNEAIEILKQDPESDVLDPGVIYERTKLLFQMRRYDEYLKSGMLLLSKHCVTLRSKAELVSLSRCNSVKQRMEVLVRHRLSRGEHFEDDNAPTFSNSTEPSMKDQYLLFLQMCNVACRLKKYGLYQRIAFTALTSKRFEVKNAHILFLCLLSCIYNNDSFNGFNVVREMVRNRKRTNTWNLLNIIIQRAEDSRHNRFVMRLLAKEDAFSYLHILHANNCLVSGSYIYALNDYVSLFKVKPSPLLAMLVSVTNLQMACQKFSGKKNQLVVQAIAWMKIYAELRGEGTEQETNYNMGRLFHQLGFLPSAIHFYKLVLNSPVPELIAKYPDLLDLRKEAAFNLHLIYLHSGNKDLARLYLDNYIIV